MPTMPTPRTPTTDRSVWIAGVAQYYYDLFIRGLLEGTPGGAKIPSNLRSFAGIAANLKDGQAADVPAGVYEWFVFWATDLANNWDTYAPGLRNAGWMLGDPPEQTLLDEELQTRIYEADRDYEAAIESARIYADGRIREAQIQADASIRVAEIAAAADREVAQIRAAADVESARIAADATVRAAAIRADADLQIALIAEAGRNYRFNLELQENARQFNATMALNIFKMGVELARSPVDWIAYQYYLSNLAVPTTMQNFFGAAWVWGAVPPSGPSVYGPVTGGPSTYYGDWEYAALTGAMPGFTSVSSALEINPGTVGTQPPPETVRQWDLMLAVSRDEVAQWTGIQEYTAAASLSLAAAQGQDNLGLVTVGGQVYSNVVDASPTALVATSPEAQSNQNLMNAVMPYATEALSLYATAAALNPESYSGQITSLAGPIAGAASSNPQQAALQIISQLTGTDAQQLGGAQFLPGYYGPNAVQQSPIFKAVQSGKLPGIYRTQSPTGWDRFGAVPALGGAQTGIRSGQDLSFWQFAHMLPSQREMVQGLIESTGQYWKDVQEQMLRSSPGGMSPFDVGSAGRMR